MTTDPTEDPVLQARYDVLLKELQRERVEGKAIKAARDRLAAEVAGLRLVLGLCPALAEPVTPRSMEP